MVQYLQAAYAHPAVYFKSSLNYLYLIQINAMKLIASTSKFKFCFVDLAGIFFFFFLQLVEFVDVKLTDTDDQLCINVLNLGWGFVRVY